MARIEDLRGRLRAALAAGDDKETILAACQALACPEVADAERLSLLVIRGEAHRRCSHFAAAEDDANRALELDSGEVRARKLRGASRYELGEFQAALEDFQAAETPGGPDFEDLLWRGACRYRTGDVAGARQEFQAAGELAPGEAVVWRWRVAICDPEGDDPQASLEEVEKAIAALPDEASFPERRASLLRVLGARDESSPRQEG